MPRDRAGRQAGRSHCRGVARVECGRGPRDPGLEPRRSRNHPLRRDAGRWCAQGRALAHLHGMSRRRKSSGSWCEEALAAAPVGEFAVTAVLVARMDAATGSRPRGGASLPLTASCRRWRPLPRRGRCRGRPARSPARAAVRSIRNASANLARRPAKPCIAAVSAWSLSNTSNAFNRRRVLSFHPLKVAAVDRIAEDAVCVTLAIPQPLREKFRFDAGQYVTVRRMIDGREERRTYSIVAPPGCCCAAHRRARAIWRTHVEGIGQRA